MAMNLLKTSEFMSEVAPLSIQTDLFPVEGSAVLGLVLIVWLLHLLLHVQEMVLTQLISAMSILALLPKSAKPSFCPVFAQFSLVHRSLNKGLVLHILIRSALLLNTLVPSHVCWDEARGLSYCLEWVRADGHWSELCILNHSSIIVVSEVHVLALELHNWEILDLCWALLADCTPN